MLSKGIRAEACLSPTNRLLCPASRRHAAVVQGDASDAASQTFMRARPTQAWDPTDSGDACLKRHCLCGPSGRPGQFWQKCQ